MVSSFRFSFHPPRSTSTHIPPLTSTHPNVDFKPRNYPMFLNPSLRNNCNEFVPPTIQRAFQESPQIKVLDRTRRMDFRQLNYLLQSWKYVHVLLYVAPDKEYHLPIPPTLSCLSGVSFLSLHLREFLAYKRYTFPITQSESFPILITNLSIRNGRFALSLIPPKVKRKTERAAEEKQ